MIAVWVVSTVEQLGELPARQVTRASTRCGNATPVTCATAVGVPAVLEGIVPIGPGKPFDVR